MFKNNVSLTREEIVQEIQDNVNDFYNFDWQHITEALLGLYHVEDWTQFPDIIEKGVNIYHDWKYGDQCFHRDVMNNGALWNFPIFEPDSVNYWIEAFVEENKDFDEEYKAPDWNEMANADIMLTLLDFARSIIDPDCIKALENIVSLRRALDALPTEKDTEASHD